MAVGTVARSWQLFHSRANGTVISRVVSMENLNQPNGISLGNSSTGEETCGALRSDMNGLLLGTLCITAMVFLILMTVIERRSSFKLHWFNGKIGPVVPLNLLDGYENRFAYSMAFGITTSYCISMIFNDAQSILGQRIAAVIRASPSYVSVFFKMIATVVVATSAYPLFVCIGTKYKKWGALFGFAYSTIWFSLFFYKFSHLIRICFSTTKESLIFEMVRELPQYVCLLLLMIYFLRQIVLSFRRSLFMNVEERSTSKMENIHMYQHVEMLLQRRDSTTTYEVERCGFIASITTRLKRSMYKPKREFKYSTRIICIFVVCFFAIYMVTVAAIKIGVMALAILPQLANITLDGYSKDLAEELQTYAELWIECYWWAVICSTVKTWIILLNMLTWYRYHLTRLRQGDRMWLPRSAWKFNGSLSFLTAQSMKFAGYQVAYAAWGYLIFVVVFWLFLGLIVSFIIHPLLKGESSFILQFLYKIWPALLITISIYVAQLVAAKYCFLMQNGKVLAIDNRKAFNITSYYLFFFNIFLGILSCLLRILKGLVLGVLFLERVQKSILPSSFEVMDPGYSAYIGYILIEHVHANPVLRVFIHLLNEHVMENRNPNSRCSSSRQNLLQNTDDAMNEDVSPDVATRIARFKIIRNRWNLAFTLIRNPGLVGLRRSGENSDKDASCESVFATRSAQQLQNLGRKVEMV